MLYLFICLFVCVDDKRKCIGLLVNCLENHTKGECVRKIVIIIIIIIIKERGMGCENGEGYKQGNVM